MKSRSLLSDRFNFLNFSPGVELKDVINLKLTKLSDIVLDEATISGVLEKIGIGYRFRLEALSAYGPIQTEVLANDAHSAVTRLARRLDDTFYGSSLK